MGIVDALFSRTQQRVLGLLFGQPDREFGTVELIELADSGRGTVQRELARLSESGLVTFTRLGQQKRYRANRDSPLFEELRSIVDKTAGVPQVIQAALAPVASRLVLAILFGSVAKHADSATSDIDVLVVSDALALEELFEALAPAERRLGRRVNPTLYTSDEYRKRRKSKQPFLTKVMSGKHIVPSSRGSIARTSAAYCIVSESKPANIATTEVVRNSRALRTASVHDCGSPARPY